MNRFFPLLRRCIPLFVLLLGFGQCFEQNAHAQNPTEPVRIAPLRYLSTPVTTTVAGSPYRYQVRTSTATANAAVVYSLTTAPQGMTIEAASGLISWTPSSAGTVRVGVRAALATNASINIAQQFGITVLPQSAGQAMVRFLTTPPANANVGSQYVYSVRAFFGVDTRLAAVPRFSPAIQYSLVNAPQGMILDATAGTIRWIPTGTGTVRFSIRAVATTVADVAVNNATQDVEVRVSQVMPQFFSQPSREAFVGVEYVYRALATLPIVQPRPATMGAITLPAILPGLAQMTYSLTTAPQGMTIEATSGVVRWTPTTTSASVRVVIRAAVVGNTTQTVTQDFTLSVRFPRVNFVSNPPSEAVLMQNYVYEPIAIVGTPNIATILPIFTNGSVRVPIQSTPGLRFSLDAAPQGMTIDAATGAVRWTVSSTGTFRVTVRATVITNANIMGTQTYSLRVGQPTARFISQPGTAYVNIGETFTYTAQAIIPTMTTATLRYGLDTPPQGMTIDSVSGAIRWMSQNAGEFPIVITARLAGQTAVIARQNFTLYVRPVACAVIRGRISYANTTATVNGATVRVVANATSANVRNGGQLVYTATVRNGEYSIVVASGAYLLAVTGGDFNEVWWGNGIVPTTSMANATPITVNCRDTVVRNVAVTRRAAAKFFLLSGRVTQASNGAGVQATVEVLGDAAPEIARETQRRTVRTDAQGNYRISLDDRFVYVVRALPDNLPLNPTQAASQLLPQYYTGMAGGSMNLTEARKITLTADVANINFALANRPVYQNSLSGTVRNTAGAAVAGKIVAFMTATTASTPQYASIEVRTEAISSSGTFAVSNLTPGEYVLQVLPASEREYSAAYYKAGTTATTLWRQATRISVSATSNERFAIVLTQRTSTTRATASAESDDITLAVQANVSNNAVSTPKNPQTIASQTATTNARNQTPLPQMLAIAPNPASSLVMVQLPMFTGEARLEVFSLLGAKLSETHLPAVLSESRFALDVSALQIGVYFVRFYGAESRASAQILVNR